MLVKRGDESFTLLTESLKSGRVAAMACDTIYGLVGAAPDTEEEIRRIKGRGESSPFLLLISDTAYLEKTARMPARTDFLSLWPGPFTFILRLRDGGTAGFRIPQDQRLRRLIRLVGKPLFSTSVNRSGEEALADPLEIERQFGDYLALVEDSGMYTGRIPSTVVDLTADPVRILRQGAGLLPPEML